RLHRQTVRDPPVPRADLRAARPPVIELETIGQRVRALALACVAGWLLYAAQFLWRGLLRSSAIDLAVAIALLVTWWSAGRGARWATHALMVTNLIGLVAAAWVAGLERAVATWSLGLFPLAAAWVGDRRSPLIWGGVSAAAVLSIHAAALLLPIRPEFVADGLEITVAQVFLVAVVTWIALSVRQAFDRQARALADARDAALAEARAKDRLLQGLGHELRTPLNAILGLSDHLGASLEDPDLRRTVDTVHRSASNLLGMLETVLHERGRGGDAQSVEVLDVVEGILDVHAVEAVHRGVELSWRPERGIPERVLVDPVAFEQLVDHLVSHAVAGARDGFVEVRVARQGVHGLVLEVEFTAHDATEEEDPLLARTLSEDLNRRLDATIAIVEPSAGGSQCVRATLPADEVSSVPGRNAVGQRVGLLLPQERTRAAITAVLESWGVLVDTDPASPDDVDVVVISSSLPDWRDRVAALGDRAALLVDAGTSIPRDLAPDTATLRLPFRRSEWMGLLTERRHRARLAPPLAPMRILVVEDDPINREVLALLLSGLGQRPEVVEDGPAAVDAACARVFDVVLMDLRLPTIDGIETTRRIRSAATHQPRILVVSASVTSAQREACLAAGADGFVDKPIDAGKLLAGLRGDATGPAERPPSAEEQAAHKALRDLAMLAGEGRDAMLRDFLSNASELVAGIESCVGRGDAEEAATRAHRLRGSAAMYGAPELARLAATMEDGIREGRPPTEDDAAGLRSALETARLRLHRTLGLPPQDPVQLG
ncbi:MAG: response regulator, partial [Myxococcales bacterium]|nr:response regulator [Myxococcales bacterium]